MYQFDLERLTGRLTGRLICLILMVILEVDVAALIVEPLNKGHSIKGYSGSSRILHSHTRGPFPRNKCLTSRPLEKHWV